MSEIQSTVKKQGLSRKDWTQGSILKNLLLLSWPMVLMETLFVTSQVVDMIWIGRLGDAAVAGAGIANIITMLVSSADFGLIAGVRAMVARHIGAGDIQSARRVAGQGFLIGIIWGALITIIGVTLARPLMNMFGMEAEVVNQGMAYMRVIFAGWVSMEILIMGLYVIQSSGDTLNPMKIELTIRILHVTLCPFLVLGLWIFPRMGVSGAALSNVISQILGGILVLFFLLGGHTRIKLFWSDFRFSLNLIWRILKIGLPALVMNLQRSCGNLALTWFIAPFGTVAVAAHSIASRIEMFVYMPSMALGAGSGVLVGQNLGAQKPERAEKGAWLALMVVEIFMVVCGSIILLWAYPIMSVFTDDMTLVGVGADFLRIAVAGYLLLAIATVLQYSIAGAGDTLPNMIISIVMIWLAQLPLAYILSHFTDLNVYGIRWGIAAGTLAGTIASFVYFRMGRWKKKRI